MKRSQCLLLTLAFLAAGSAGAQTPEARPADPGATAPAAAPPAETPPEQERRTRPPVLTGADCLDPEWARSWHYLNDRQVLVDAGRRHYRITFFNSCYELSGAPDLVLKGDAVTGRVCGYMSDAALVRDHKCSLESIEIISAEEYDAARKRPRAEAEVSAPVKP